MRQALYTGAKEIEQVGAEDVVGVEQAQSLCLADGECFALFTGYVSATMAAEKTKKVLAEK